MPLNQIIYQSIIIISNRLEYFALDHCNGFNLDNNSLPSIFRVGQFKCGIITKRYPTLFKRIAQKTPLLFLSKIIYFYRNLNYKTNDDEI